MANGCERSTGPKGRFVYAANGRDRLRTVVRRFPKPRVGGSSPSGGTTYTDLYYPARYNHAQYGEGATVRRKDAVSDLALRITNHADSVRANQLTEVHSWATRTSDTRVLRSLAARAG